MAVDTSNATATAGADPSRVRIAGAIKQASNTTGTSFEYLLATAKMESDFNPTAGASTSSAHGLYQFIDQTWLGTVKEAGAQLGYGNYADAITKSSSGSYSVSDPAAANRSIFFDHSGHAYSVSQVYSVLSSRYASAASSPTARDAIATFGASPVATGANAAQVVKPAFLSSFPDVQPAAIASASPSTTPSGSAPAAPIFRSLFQVGERAQPVSSAVHELWGNSSSMTSVAPATSVASATSVAPAQVPSSSPQAPNTNAPQPLDLFSDRTGAFSS